MKSTFLFKFIGFYGLIYIKLNILKIGFFVGYYEMKEQMNVPE